MSRKDYPDQRRQQERRTILLESCDDGGCSRQVFTEAVIQSVDKQMKNIAQPNMRLVPNYLQLKPAMLRANLGDAALTRLDVTPSSDGMVVREVGRMRGRQAIREHSQAKGAGSICFAVRRPGYPAHLEGFQLFGVVKEIGVDDEGLVEFSKDYFGQGVPLYCDKTYAFYQALGDRKANSLPSLWALAKGLYRSVSRTRQKGISMTSPSKGEGLTLGGLIIFDHTGLPAYVYEEETTQDLPIADILAALDAVRRRRMQEERP